MCVPTAGHAWECKHVSLFFREGMVCAWELAFQFCAWEGAWGSCPGMLVCLGGSMRFCPGMQVCAFVLYKCFCICACEVVIDRDFCLVVPVVLRFKGFLHIKWTQVLKWNERGSKTSLAYEAMAGNLLHLFRFLCYLMFPWIFPRLIFLHLKMI